MMQYWNAGGIPLLITVLMLCFGSNFKKYAVWYGREWMNSLLKKWKRRGNQIRDSMMISSWCLWCSILMFLEIGFQSFKLSYLSCTTRIGTRVVRIQLESTRMYEYAPQRTDGRKLCQFDRHLFVSGGRNVHEHASKHAFPHRMLAWQVEWCSFISSVHVVYSMRYT